MKKLSLFLFALSLIPITPNIKGMNTANQDIQAQIDSDRSQILI